MGNIIKPTWYEMDRGSAVLSIKLEKVHGAQMPFEYIVGVAQGGLFPAMILSGLFDIPMLAAGIGPMTDVDDNLTALPEIKGGVTSGMGLLPPAPPLLIINSETSFEMNKVIQHYINKQHQVLTAALYYREDGNGLRPNFFWNTIEEDDVVYYPWETHND